MLDPVIATVRRVVRESLAPFAESGARVLVALSGGADSLALAAATALEAPRVGVEPVTVIVDHGLQDGSARVAARAAEQANALGIPDARVVRVHVGQDGGPEAAAREARYAAIREVAAETGAAAVLVGHTLDDQAETVLLGLARGSGAASLMGMAPHTVDERGLAWVRPLLGVHRADTHAFCAHEGLDAWADPQNADARFARVRVRERVLPLLEDELGPGIAEALARTAEQLREDNDAFADMIEEIIEDIVEHSEAGIAVSVAALAANPAALRNRIIRHVVRAEFGVSLTRAQTVEVARLVTHWKGQGPIPLPGAVAARRGALLHLTANAHG